MVAEPDSPTDAKKHQYQLPQHFFGNSGGSWGITVLGEDPEQSKKMQFTKECDPTGFWTKQVMGEEIVGPYDVYADPEKGGHAFEVVNAILLRDALRNFGEDKKIAKVGKEYKIYKMLREEWAEREEVGQGDVTRRMGRKGRSRAGRCYAKNGPKGKK